MLVYVVYIANMFLTHETRMRNVRNKATPMVRRLLNKMGSAHYDRMN